MPPKREFDELQEDGAYEDGSDFDSASRSNGASPTKRTRYAPQVGSNNKDFERDLSLSPSQDVSPRTPSKVPRQTEYDTAGGLSMYLTALPPFGMHCRTIAGEPRTAGPLTGRPLKRVAPLPQAPHTHEGIPSRILGSPSQYFKYPPKPLDTPTNPFGRTRRFTLSQSLPPPTRFSQHLPLRFQFVRCPNPDVKGKGKARDLDEDSEEWDDENLQHVSTMRSTLKKKGRKTLIEPKVEHIPPRHGGVYRICQVPLSYTFLHLRLLIAWLFSPRGWKARKHDVRTFLEEETKRKKYWFEVKEGMEMYSITYKPGEMKGGKMVNKLSMVKDPSVQEAHEEDATVNRSSSPEGDEEEESEDWTWQPEDDFTLHNAWPSGLDVHRGIIYHHDETTEIHISVNTGEVEQRRGRSNSPYVFSARGRVFLPGHVACPKESRGSLKHHKPLGKGARDEPQLIDDSLPSSPSPPARVHNRGLGNLPKRSMLFWEEDADHDMQDDTDVEEDETSEDIDVFPSVEQWNDCEEDFERFFTTCNANAGHRKSSPESSPLPSPGDYPDAIPLVLDLSESRAGSEGLPEDEGPGDSSDFIQEEDPDDVFSIHDVPLPSSSPFMHTDLELDGDLDLDNSENQPRSLNFTQDDLDPSGECSSPLLPSEPRATKKSIFPSTSASIPFPLVTNGSYTYASAATSRSSSRAQSPTRSPQTGMSTATFFMLPPSSSPATSPLMAPSDLDPPSDSEKFIPRDVMARPSSAWGIESEYETDGDADAEGDSDLENDATATLANASYASISSTSSKLVAEATEALLAKYPKFTPAPAKGQRKKIERVKRRLEMLSRRVARADKQAKRVVTKPEVRIKGKWIKQDAKVKVDPFAGVKGKEKAKYGVWLEPYEDEDEDEEDVARQINGEDDAQGSTEEEEGQEERGGGGDEKGLSFGTCALEDVLGAAKASLGVARGRGGVARRGLRGRRR